MYSTGLLNTVSRFVISKVLVPSRNISVNPPLCLNVTNVLFAEPLKKKKRMDPALIKAKEERRRKKLEKSIRRLQKHARQLKPISEIEVAISLRKKLQEGTADLQPLSVEQLEQRAQFLNEWSKFKKKEHLETLQLIDKWVSAQDKTLNKLKAVSEELYEQAIAIDPGVLPYSARGPTITPPIENFDPPDGEYIDITKKYEGET